METHTATQAPYNLTVRSFKLDIETLPRHWFDNNALLTHAINAQNLFFPEMERFMIRVVRRYRPTLSDPALRDAVKDFIGQEVHHGRTHDVALDLLRAQGFQIDGWLAGYRWCMTTFERLAPTWLCLSVIAATEHFTASIGECWLTEGKMPLAHPDMAALLGWHAAEEIEHKAVTFDVLQEVEPRWGHRMLGLLLAVVFLLLMLVSATGMLLWQDPEVTLQRLRTERRAAGKENIRATRFIERHVGPYLRRDFHPNDKDNLHIAHAYLAQLAPQLRVRPTQAA